MLRVSVTPSDLKTRQRPSVVANPNVIWSSGETWSGLTIERRRVDKKPVSECQLSNYSLVFQLSSPSAAKHPAKYYPQSQNNNCGNLCFLSAGAPRQICAHQQREVIILTLSASVMSRAATESCGTLNLELAEQHQFYDVQLEHLILALKTEAEAGYLSGKIYGDSLCIALSTHLVTKYSAGQQTVCSIHKGGMTPLSLRRVVDYIHDNLPEDIRLSELAKVAGLSQHRFAHNFKQTIGVAPHQFVIRERMKRAKQLLRETNLTVTTIAHSVGCVSPSRFTVLFQRATGVTPSAYRASSK